MTQRFSSDEFLFLRIVEVDPASTSSGVRADPPLSEDAIKVARKVARGFAKNKPKVKTICCSPMLCAIQMADILHDELPVKLRVVQELRDSSAQDETDEKFRERVARAVEQALSFPGPVLIVGHDRFTETLMKILGVADKAALDRGVPYRFLFKDGWSFSGA